jgi:hypothetical protein
LLWLLFWSLRSCFLPLLAWTAILPFYTFHHCWNDRHTQLFSIEMERYKLFCPGGPQTSILPSSTSLQVTKITGMNHTSIQLKIMHLSVMVLERTGIGRHPSHAIKERTPLSSIPYLLEPWSPLHQYDKKRFYFIGFQLLLQLRNAQN